MLGSVLKFAGSTVATGGLFAAHKTVGIGRALQFGAGATAFGVGRHLHQRIQRGQETFGTEYGAGWGYLAMGAGFLAGAPMMVGGLTGGAANLISRGASSLGRHGVKTWSVRRHGGIGYFPSRLGGPAAPGVGAAWSTGGATASHGVIRGDVSRRGLSTPIAWSSATNIATGAGKGAHMLGQGAATLRRYGAKWAYGMEGKAAMMGLGMVRDLAYAAPMAAALPAFDVARRGIGA